jgi:hypothetical protein
MFVPLVNIIMAFVLGVKGSSWAWRNRKWESIEHFKATQRQWTKWSLIVYGASVVFFVGIFFATTAALKSSDAFLMAVKSVETNQEATEFLGKPISMGTPTGDFSISGPNGSAKLTFSVEGSKGKGTVYLDAVKKSGEWKFNDIVLEEAENGNRIHLSD